MITKGRSLLLDGHRPNGRRRCFVHSDLPGGEVFILSPEYLFNVNIFHLCTPGHLLLSRSPLLPLPKVPRLGLLHQGDLVGRPAQEANPAGDDGQDTLAAPWTPCHDPRTTCLHGSWWSWRSWRAGMSWL